MLNSAVADLAPTRGASSTSSAVEPSLLRRRQQRLVLTVLIGVDALALILAVSLAGALRVAIDDVLPVASLGFTQRHLIASVLVVPVLVLLFWLQGRYDLEQCLIGPREYAQIAHTVTYGVVIMVALSYFAGGEPLVSRSWLLLTWASSIVGVCVGRFGARRVLRWLRRHGSLRTRVVIVGASTLGVELAARFQAAPGEGVDVVGFIDEYLPIGQVLLPGVPVLGRPCELIAGRRQGVDEYILVPPALPHQRLEEITRLMVSREGPILRLAVSSSDLLTHGLRVTERGHVPLVTLRRARLGAFDRMLKRGLDLVVASAGLIVVWPPLLLAVLRARLSGRHRIAYRERVYAAGGGKADVWLLDHAATSYLPLRGAPALLAVLAGKLSLVGPRPIAWRPDQPVQPAVWVTAVQPGLTGRWRLTGPHATLRDQALEDLTYVRNYTIWEDLRILWESVVLLASGDGARLGRWQDPAQEPECTGGVPHSALSA